MYRTEMKKASILTIGDEVTDGQIINSNASWLARSLVNIDFEVRHHLSAKDKKEDIHSCLNFLAKTSSLIVTTGGLGPTSDDTTRSSISSWLNLKLVEDSDYWQKIQENLTKRQVVIRPEHKNQSLIPAGANILDNNAGVAPGFLAKKGPLYIASLPGPPRELKAIWKNSLSSLLIEKLTPTKEFDLITFICFNLPESDLQYRIQGLLKGSGYRYGFRLHKPYVELKLWIPIADKKEPHLCQKVIDSLGEYYMGPLISPLRNQFVTQFTNKPMAFFDLVSNGQFQKKIKEALGPKSNFYYSHCANGKISENEKLSTSFIEFSKSIGFDPIIFFPLGKQRGAFQWKSLRYEVDLPRSITIKSQLGQLFFLEKFFHSFQNNP